MEELAEYCETALLVIPKTSCSRMRVNRTLSKVLRLIKGVKFSEATALLKSTLRTRSLLEQRYAGFHITKKGTNSRVSWNQHEPALNDLRKELTEKVISQQDVASPISKEVSGYFCLPGNPCIRNQRLDNRLRLDWEPALE